jgi:probable HAF family extracellular repeat protein
MLNSRGEIAGFSDTPNPDPNGENFCGFGTNLICLPFVWQKGVMTPLPTLGGNNGSALGINDQGQIVGQAEGPNSDPCSPFALEVKAVIWRDGQIQQVLPPLGGSAAVASALNDNGQAVGLAGCITGNVYAVLWQHGMPIDLGSLGGVIGNLPSGLNNRGQVVGQSDLPGDTTHHAFLWQNGVMSDLGNLPGLPQSVSNGINNHGQVVGFSQDANGDDSSSVAFLWQNGILTDLNTLIPADSPWFLMEALGINDRGQIAGFMSNTLTGEVHGFLLTPVQGTESSPPAAQRSTSRRPLVVLPENVRQMLRLHYGFNRACIEIDNHSRSRRAVQQPS